MASTSKGQITNSDKYNNAYKNMFPSVMGIQMGNRLNETLFHSIMEKVAE